MYDNHNQHGYTPFRALPSALPQNISNNYADYHLILTFGSRYPII